MTSKKEFSGKELFWIVMSILILLLLIFNFMALTIGTKENYEKENKCLNSKNYFSPQDCFNAGEDVWICNNRAIKNNLKIFNYTK